MKAFEKDRLAVEQKTTSAGFHACPTLRTKLENVPGSPASLSAFTGSESQFDCFSKTDCIYKGSVIVKLVYSLQAIWQ